MAQLSTGCVHVFVSNKYTITYSSPGYDPAFASPGWNPPPDPDASRIPVPLYLGTCESMPKDERELAYETVMTDSSGTKIPFDLAWQGSSAQISLTMTRVIQETVEKVMATPTRRNPGFFGANNPPGKWRFNDVGTLMMLEGFTWQLFLVYQFTGISRKNVYADRGATRYDHSLRRGRRYAQVIPWTPQSEETGTRPMKQHLMFYAWPQPNYQDKTYTLYDYDIPVNIGDYIE